MERNHTPGPWAWFANTLNGNCSLATTHSGRHSVLLFSRVGMQGAAPLFKNQTTDTMDRFDRLDLGQDHNGLIDLSKNPDARLIASAPELLDAMEAIKKLLIDSINVNPFSLEQIEALAIARKAIDTATGKGEDPVNQMSVDDDEPF